MKRFLRYIPVFLVCLILAVSPVLMLVNASAWYPGDLVVDPIDKIDLPGANNPAFVDGFLEDDLGGYFTWNGMLSDSSEIVFGSVFSLADFSSISQIYCVVATFDGSEFTYSVEYPQIEFDVDEFYLNIDGSKYAILQDGYIIMFQVDVPGEVKFIQSCVFTSDYSGGNPVVPNGIYQSVFDLIHTHIYGGVELSADMNLVCTLLATAACVFVFALPFLIAWFVIKLIGGR